MIIVLFKNWKKIPSPFKAAWLVYLFLPWLTKYTYHDNVNTTCQCNDSTHRGICIVSALSRVGVTSSANIKLFLTFVYTVLGSEWGF